MKTKILFCLLITLSVFSAAGQSGSLYCNICRKLVGNENQYRAHMCNVHGIGCPGNNGGNNNGGYSGPSQDQIDAQNAAAAQQQAAAAAQKAADEQKQRADQAQSLKDQGIDAYNRQNYEAAIQSFQGALEITPDDSTLTDWIQKAKDAIAAKQKRAQEAFNASKQEGLSQLRGLSQGGSFDSGTGLKGIGSTDSGLKGLDDNPKRTGTGVTANDSSGLKTLSEVNTDTRVVDARNVPSGLPKSVDAAIPHTPAGDRMRKGYEAIQDGDWKVALAWFQDALNHEPGDPDLQRLVDLSQFTLVYRAKPQTPAGGKDSTQTQTTQPPKEDNRKYYPGGEAAKLGESDMALESANAVVGRARADALIKQYEAKYGDRPLKWKEWVEEQQKAKAAYRGEGYTKEELKAQLEQALKDYHKRHANDPPATPSGPATCDEVIIGGKG